MRLLRCESNGEFSLTKEYLEEPPPYAILSHTWGSDSDEVTFKDIEKGRGKSKSGYDKLRFCAARAEKDGLEYFWVDTCCIDKKDSVKLSEAINSMFSWYQRSAVCYVYLTDVATWGPVTFESSRWFTRGWTLQELLAPTSVKFFSPNGRYLGDRNSLAEQIHIITGISVRALQETRLSPSNYSVDERMSWARGRETKRQEDAAYSLLGLFGVYMPPIYGEGREHAFERLHGEIERKRTLVPSTEPSYPLPEPLAVKREGEEDSSSFTPLSSSGVLSFPDVQIPLSRPSETDEPSQHSASTQGLIVSSYHKMVQDKNIEMKQWWDEAVAVNTETTGPYEKVAVLLVRWADELDDLETSEDVNKLAHVFDSKFGFSTEILILANWTTPQHDMDQALNTFIQYNDGPRNLLIVYYNGLSEYHTDQNQLELMGHKTPRYRQKRDPPSVNWNKSHDVLGSGAVADVLMILDTPHASNIASWWTNERGPNRFLLPSRNRTNHFEQHSAKRFELICPSEFDPVPRARTFTYALIRVLIIFAGTNTSQVLSTWSLNERICEDPKRIDMESSILRTLPGAKRCIFLVPMGKVPDRFLQPKQKGKGYLKLGLELREEALSQTQIEEIVRTLTTLEKKNGSLGLFGIDWLGFQSKGSAVTFFVRAVQVIVFARRWLLRVRRRKRILERASGMTVDAIRRRGFGWARVGI